MALSETNTVKICQILNVTTQDLSAQITYIGSRLTSTVQSAIEAQIDLWDTAATNFTNIKPNIKNFGAEISSGSARASIRQQIAILLERPEWGMTGQRLVRV